MYFLYLLSPYFLFVFTHVRTRCFLCVSQTEASCTGYVSQGTKCVSSRNRIHTRGKSGLAGCRRVGRRGGECMDKTGSATTKRYAAAVHTREAALQPVDCSASVW